MMSYSEKQMVMATVLAKYAKEGFIASAHDAAKKILDTDDISLITQLIECLLIERELVQETEKDLEWKQNYYTKAEDAGDDQD